MNKRIRKKKIKALNAEFYKLIISSDKAFKAWENCVVNFDIAKPIMSEMRICTWPEGEDVTHLFKEPRLTINGEKIPILNH